MAFESSGLSSAIAAAAGDDLALLAELRGVFRESVGREIDLLGRARCDGNWTVSAQRLRGLAETFHADDLAELAQHALDAAPGDPVALRGLHEYARALAPTAQG